MTIDRPDRQFQVWAYSVSLSRLLLRSTKAPDVLTRVDVLFQGVEAIAAPVVFDGLLVAEVTDEDELRSASARLGLTGEGRVFRVTGRDQTGYVRASLVAEHEDESEFHDPSALWAGFPELK